MCSFQQLLDLKQEYENDPLIVITTRDVTQESLSLQTEKENTAFLTQNSKDSLA